MHFRFLDTINSTVCPINVDIDKALRVIFPINIVAYTPDPIRHVLGGRHPDEPRQTAPNLLLKSWWTLFNTFAGLTVIGATVKYGSYFVNGRHVYGLAPSSGATAILIYNALESPLAQPRNVFFGTVISAIIGVGMCKLFMLGDNADYLWLSGALAVAVSSVVMSLTKTVHPPAGAAALLASITPDFRQLGWKYVVLQIVSMVLMLSVACLLNNIQMRYPLYWLYDTPPSSVEVTPETPAEFNPDFEKEVENDNSAVTISSNGIHSPINLTGAEKEVLANIQDRLSSTLLHPHLSHLSNRY